MPHLYKPLLLALFLNAVSATTPKKKLNDGNEIPILALGSGGVSGDEIAKMRQTINWAIEVGYRHIDTAAMYDTESEIGLGIADVIGRGLVNRSDLYITTKIGNDRHACDQVVPALRESLQRLGLDYVDLFLMHTPFAVKEDGTFENIDYLDTWRGMEEAQKLGLTKSIGVSNFNAEQLDRLVAHSRTKPALNQFEVNPTFTQKDLVGHCQQLGVAVAAYSPLGYIVERDSSDAPPPRIDDPTLVRIGKKYGKSAVQVVLRYLIDRGLIPVTRTSKKHHLQESIDVFDFQLTPSEVETIDDFNKDIRVIDWSEFNAHPFYSVNKE